MVGVINISWGNGHCQSWIAGNVLWRIQFKMFNPDAMCTEKGCRMGLWMYPTAQDEQHLFPQPGSSRWQLLWTCLRIISHCVLHSGPDLKSVETFTSGPCVFKDLRSLWWTPVNAYGAVWFTGCTPSDFPVHWRVNEVEVCPFFSASHQIEMSWAKRFLHAVHDQKSLARPWKPLELWSPIWTWHWALNALRELQALLCFLGSLTGSLTVFPQVGRCL